LRCRGLSRFDDVGAEGFGFWAVSAAGVRDEKRELHGDQRKELDTPNGALDSTPEAESEPETEAEFEEP
jgi:hypothetical protein